MLFQVVCLTVCAYATILIVPYMLIKKLFRRLADKQELVKVEISKVSCGKSFTKMILNYQEDHLCKPKM